MKKAIKVVDEPNFDVLDHARYIGVEYDYDSTHCGCTGREGDGCDGYGRCSTITNTRITKVDPVAIAEKIAENIKDPFTRYCVERVVVHSGVREKDNWECRVGGGYYGEEIHGVELSSWSVKNDLIEAVNAVCNASTNKEKIHLALKAEYGYILPALEHIENWEIKTVSRDSVMVPQGSHYMRLDAKILGWYEDYEGPVGVGVTDSQKAETWRLVDGYHRFFTTEGQKEVSLIVGF